MKADPARKGGVRNELQEIVEEIKARRFKDKDNYLLSWLNASPTRLRSSETSVDKRYELVLDALSSNFDIKDYPARSDKPR